MRILMMGTGPFAVPTFRSLLDSPHEIAGHVTRPVPPARGRRKTPPNPMRDVAEQAGLNVLAPADSNSEEGRQQMATLAPDLLVVCDFGQILSTEALQLAPLGGINLHASLLPEYRGAAPINWALLDGRNQTGVTVIHMTPKLDGGPCLVKLSTPIRPEEDAVGLECRLSELGVEAVWRSIAMLEAWDGSSLIGEIQNPALATRAPRLKKSDGVVDWTKSARQIADQVRALKPWPGTYTDLAPSDSRKQARRLILDAVSVASEAEEGTPGEVVASDRNRLLVAAGGGVLSLDRVQPAGKRVMEISEFLRGHAILPGETFAAASN